MPDNNWIAIGSLAVAALGILVPYLTNKMNIKARHADIVTEKSIEVFREFVAKLTKVHRLFSDIALPTNATALEKHIEVSTEASTKLRQQMDDCQMFIDDYQLYFPEAISQSVVDLLFYWFTFAGKCEEENMMQQELIELYATAGSKLGSVVEQIQGHIGIVETKKRG